MIIAQSIFQNVDDLTATFSVGDIAISLSLAAVLTIVIAFVYRATHHGVSYSQSYVQTLVLLGILVSLIMLVVGSNIARVRSLWSARFRSCVSAMQSRRPAMSDSYSSPWQSAWRPGPGSTCSLPSPPS